MSAVTSPAQDSRPSLKATPVVLVTGPSGAGRLTAIRALEDLGFEAIDNLPLSLFHRVLMDGLDRPLAIGIDVRNRDFSPLSAVTVYDELNANRTYAAELLYLDCSAEVLLRRYSETRRRHPLSEAESPEIGIAAERELLEPIRERATIVVDTSELSPHDLRDRLTKWFDTDQSARLAISVQSFSYKRGTPPGLDMAFDCRFLRNPHWDAKLRALDGRNPEVADYVAADPRHAEFFNKVADLMELLLPAFREEGKSYLSIGFGCTGGKHRSVALAEKLRQRLANQGWQASIRHRELERRAKRTPPQVGDNG